MKNKSIRRLWAILPKVYHFCGAFVYYSKLLTFDTVRRCRALGPTAVNARVS
jgi:hypothetical protein